MTKKNRLSWLMPLLLVQLTAFFIVPADAEEVDLFISAGQSNAASQGFAFGVGIENVVAQSDLFSNAEVVKTAKSGAQIVRWIDEDGKLNKFYHEHFFSHAKNAGEAGQLEKRIKEIEAQGDTVRFRGSSGFREKLRSKPKLKRSISKDSPCFLSS